MVVPTTREWLKKIIAELGKSRAKVARMANCDASQLANWLQGRQPIPIDRVVEIAALKDPSEVRYASTLAVCETTYRRLGSVCQRLEERLELDRGAIHEVMGNLAIGLAEDRSRQMDEDYLFKFTHFLTDAMFAVRLALDSYGGKGAPTVDRENIARHLCYPVNRFFGRLIELDAFVSVQESAARRVTELREILLFGLRIIAKRRTRPQYDSLCREHAVHMLARHGQDADGEYVEDLLASNNVFLRRMAYYGLLLRKTDIEFAERFLHELQASDLSAQVLVSFDAVHYRDAKLGEDGTYPCAVSSFHNALIRTACSLNIEPHKGIRDISFFKLNLMLRLSRRHTLTHTNLTQSLAELELALRSQESSSLTTHERSFLHNVRRLPKIAA